ncbi:DUF397 domain-containing protein [Prauserella muralis]|uniref:DUF397 domain-containing protein n=1 Tax=Prauserella muralis TaxID=588067 RepID=A0A2V4AYY1_9PSEU|nr:DUF397 domain-containing protein [Prauserella muralis]PXY27037.1 DUF397 domain-containing protein [Prauserella muralis]TWE23338.1 uncharacterized protein DUF397 [Prauserella muralis]
MSESSPAALDDKVAVRDGLDLDSAVWRRLEQGPDTVEFSFVPHTDGVTYVAMRQASDPDGLVLVFTPSEWDAFLAGIRDGEFDRPR